MLARIDQYSDYRRYLRDFYEDQKARKKPFSFRFFNLRAGISSPSHFREVMTGKRNLTPQTIAAYIKGLGLRDLDAKYFGALVYYNQSDTEAQKQYHLEKLVTMKRRVLQRKVGRERFPYYSHWLNLVVRELACLRDWGEDVGAMAKAVHPPVKKAELQASLDLLLELGFLERSDEGRFIQKEPAITSGGEDEKQVIRNLNMQLALMGAEALGTVPKEERDISSLVIGLSAGGFEQLRGEIQDFKQRVLRIVEEDCAADRVYNLNMQLFPMSRPANHE